MRSLAPSGGTRTISVNNPPIGVAASRPETTKDLVARAFELAYFIHGDRQSAVRVVASALMKLDVATARQDKRLYYHPTGRFGRARTKVVVDRAQLLQRLLMIESEPLERAKEKSGQARPEDLLVHFVKDLVRITVKRNSFYVALGTSRLLYSYTTAETMHIYDALAADPVHVRDDSYYRSRKGRLMSELQDRFGALLTVVRGARGEDRFRSRDTTSRERDLIQEALSLLTPWGTSCSGVPVQSSYNAGRAGIEGVDPMDEELSRFHAILHPSCYERLTESLDLPAPQTRLEVPRFGCDSDEDRPTRLRRTALLDEERSEMEAMLDSASRARRSAPAGALRVLVDGVDRLNFDASDHRAELRVDDDAELIEILSGRGDQAVVLATHLFAEGQEALEGITLEGGQRISISVAPVAGGGAVIGIDYRHRAWDDVRRRVARWAARLFRVGAPITAAVALAILVMQPRPNETRPTEQKAPAIASAPTRESAPLVPQHPSAPATEPLTRGAAPESGVSLGKVHTIWIAGGDDELGSSLAGTLGEHWTVSTSPDEADAALKIVEVHAGAVRVRLVNANGTVLWPAREEGRVYEGDTRAIAKRITADLIAASARR